MSCQPPPTRLPFQTPFPHRPRYLLHTLHTGRRRFLYTTRKSARRLPHRKCCAQVPAPAASKPPHHPYTESKTCIPGNRQTASSESAPAIRQAQFPASQTDKSDRLKLWEARFLPSRDQLYSSHTDRESVPPAALLTSLVSPASAPGDADRKNRPPAAADLPCMLLPAWSGMP